MELAVQGDKLKDRLKQLQEESGMSHWQMEQAIGLSKSSISAWIRGEIMPNSKSLILLCDYFDVSADWLLGRSDFRKVKRNG